MQLLRPALLYIKWHCKRYGGSIFVSCKPGVLHLKCKQCKKNLKADESNELRLSHTLAAPTTIGRIRIRIRLQIVPPNYTALTLHTLLISSILRNNTISPTGDGLFNDQKLSQSTY